MGRPKKRTVDYFPHVIKDGRSLFVLESKWGNDGYAFLWKLMELLAQSDGHVMDAGNPATMEFLTAKTRLDEQIAIEMLEKLARIEKIDRELWEHNHTIWCQDLVDSIKDAYRKRMEDYPSRPTISISGVVNTESSKFPTSETQNIDSFSGGNGESKVKERKEKESKVNNSGGNNSDYSALSELMNDETFDPDILAPEATALALLDLFKTRYQEIHQKSYIVGKWDKKTLVDLIKLNGFKPVHDSIADYMALDRRHLVKEFADHISDGFNRIETKRRSNESMFD